MVNYSCLSLNGDYEINEDRIGIIDTPQRKCFILCDGLGGHGKGEVASAIAVDYAKNYLLKCKYINKHILEDCFLGAHQQLKNRQHMERDYKSVKTTMVILVIENDIAYWGHVGDSRLYLFNRFSIVERTKDHSVPQMMVALGEITEDQIRGNPDRNRLLKALGMDEPPKVEIHSPVIRAKRGCGFLLCSDGFWEWITEDKMQHTYRYSGGTDKWIGQMKQIVEMNGRNGKMDNYSAIAIKIR